MATEKRLIERIAERLKDAYPQADRNNLCPAIYYDDFSEIVDDVLSEIGESVDAVEVVHGRWKNVKETEVYSPDHRCTFTHTAQHCSVCNVRIGFIGAKFYLYDGYCPNCGAKMDGQ